MTISPYRLYASGYAAADAPGIYAFTFDATSGSLVAGWSFAGISNPSFIQVHPNGRWLYAVSETSQQDSGPGEVWSLDLAGPVSKPVVLNHLESGGDWPCHISIDASGRWLLVTNYSSGSLAVFPIQENGALGAMARFVEHHGSGPNPQRQEAPHPHSSIFAPDNRFVVVADLGIDRLVVYAFDPASGNLQRQSEVPTRPGAGPRHMVFHPSGQRFYVANELDNTVGVYDYRAEDGELSNRQIIGTLPPGAPENTVADIHLGPAGNRLYVSNRGHDSIAVFSLAEDGLLERIAVESCGGSWPRNFAVAPDGQFLFVANQFSNTLVALPVLPQTLAPGQPGITATVHGPACVRVIASTFHRS